MKKLEEMNLMDDFLFGSMLSCEEVGEAFAREVLETIFDRKFGKLTVTPQKVYYGEDTDRHGARLDVYVEETGDWQQVSEIIDAEVQKIKDEAQRISLPRRVRFYHAKIGSSGLQSGEDYQRLKSVIVIMILPSDPFGLDRVIYTIKNSCVEQPDMPYEDGARTIFLYTKGKRGEVSEALRQMLCYFEKSTPENATNEQLKRIHQMVEFVKKGRRYRKNICFGQRENVFGSQRCGVRFGKRCARKCVERSARKYARRSAKRNGREWKRL